tara:strand:+ start:639 stop:887 length:249 start_codon:yes stop_codon:yes gene_type:complete
MYATALSDLFEEDGEEDGRLVAATGSRVLLVYPQRHDKTTGKVSMRIKTIDEDTGQLKYTWVVVFSGVDTDIRRAGNFSLLS